jgi:H+/gluconate symporter-like permease
MDILGIALFIIFIIAVIMMSRDLMPTAIVLPLMAILMAIIGGATYKEVINTVITEGASRLASSIIIVIFSVWLGRILLNTGIAENIIRKASEYAGDKPLLIAILVTAASAFILTSIRGLGAFILVGTIALPIMMSVGISHLQAATFLLLGYSIGNLLNMGTWGIFRGIFEIEVSEIGTFVFIITGLLSLATIIYIIRELKLSTKKYWAVTDSNKKNKVDYKQVPLISMLTPAVPLVLVMGFKMGIIPSIMIAMFYGIITTQIKRPVKEIYNIVQSALFEGFKDAAPAITLMIGIGMLLKTVKLESVTGHLQPLMQAVIPTSTIGYIVFFSLAIPFVLYRGPFNMWGLGAGLVTLIMSTGYFAPQAIMAVFMVGVSVQQAVEPTNTHNVWAASYTETDVISILKKILLWTWVPAVVSIIIASFMYV